jgi:hypothetical protein
MARSRSATTVTRVPEQREFIDQLRPVVDFMRQQYWYVYEPAARNRMLAALAVVGNADTQPVVAADD